MTKVWAIYNSPAGAPAPLTVLEWDAEPGAAARHGEPVFAASLELARDAIPKGLERRDPIEHKGEAKDLVETWEPAA